MIFFDIDNTLLDYATTGNTAALCFLDQYKKDLPYSAEAFLPFWMSLQKNIMLNS